jgi:adenosylmethionine-8-amino-7-oxononanoate aminotransferase
MGKTGTMHAWEQEGISGPDIQTVAKALGGGFIPISAVLMNQKVVDALSAGTGVLQHGQTYQVSSAILARWRFSTNESRHIQQPVQRQLKCKG